MRSAPRRSPNLALTLVSLLLAAGCSESSSEAGTAARCGNGRLDAGELCDGADLGGSSCTDFQLDPAGVLSCTDECVFDVSACGTIECGNGRIDLFAALGEQCEQCDGDDLGARSCAALRGEGSVECDTSCFATTALCSHVCGNGIHESGEVCDFGQAFACEDLGYGSGFATCDVRVWGTFTSFDSTTAAFQDPVVFRKCSIDANSCSSFRSLDTATTCGDGTLTRDEECERGREPPVSCAHFGGSGTLACTSECRIDFSSCVFGASKGTCGNGMIDAGEECEAGRVDPSLSESLPGGGVLCAIRALSRGLDPCLPDCTVNRSLCSVLTNDLFAEGSCETTCGDGVVNHPREECDGADLRGVTCEDLGGSGELACNDFCGFDRTHCDDVAGNGRRESGETCDGIAFPPCTAFLPFIPDDLGGQTCESLGYGTGDFLVCRLNHPFGLDSHPDRSFPRYKLVPSLETNCTLAPEPDRQCGNGIIDSPEDCDGTDLNGFTCADFDAVGDLRCEGCRFDLSGCQETAACGNGVIEFPEECEGDDLRGESCAIDGGQGTYRCDPVFCFIDRSGCSKSCDPSGVGVVPFELVGSAGDPSHAAR